MSRQLSVNGNIFFVVGTKFGGIVNRNPKEVPLSQILNHVSQAELQRFENQDFLEEDVREASRPPPKPMGRPIGSKLIDGRLVLAGASTGPPSAQKPQTQLSRPVVVVPSSSRAVHQGAAFAASSRTSHLAIKVLAPNVSQQVAVRVPSFNGPQPGQIRHVPETDASSESSEDELSCQRPTRRPQYAMIAASGLASLKTSQEEETSREVSVSRTASPEAAVSYNHEQSSKRRRLNTQLPLRATVPIMQPNGSNATSKSYSGKEAVVGTKAQSAPLISVTKSDCIKYGTLDEHANNLPPRWPNPGSSRVAAQDYPFRPRNSSFPLDFDRGRYPAQRRRRRKKFYSPERTSASVAGTLSKPSVPADSVPQESPARSDVEDLDMVDMLEIRDEEAEREAILWQFQPTKIQQCRQPSSSLLMPKPVIATPPRNTISRPASFPLSAEKTSVVARDIPIVINGQSQLAQPSLAPSTRVTTPEKSFQKRASLTPHYPRGVKFGPDTLSGISSHQSYETRPDHSPSKTTAQTTSKTMLLTTEGTKPPYTATLNKARVSESHSNSANSRAIAKASALNSSKSPPRDSTGLTIPTKNQSSNHSNIRIKPSTYINGTAKKHRLKTPTPINDITKYFRPKSVPAEAPPPPPSSEDDETESEDQLTLASSHNPTIPLLHTRNLPHPAPAQAASDSNNDSMSPLVQRPNQRTTPIRALDDESTDEARDVEVLDSEDESQEVSDSEGEDGNGFDGESMQRSEQLSHHPLIDGDMQAFGESVEVENGFGGEGEEVESSSETDSLGSEVIVVQSRGW